MFDACLTILVKCLTNFYIDRTHCQNKIKILTAALIHTYSAYNTRYTCTCIHYKLNTTNTRTHMYIYMCVRVFVAKDYPQTERLHKSVVPVHDLTQRVLAVIETMKARVVHIHYKQLQFEDGAHVNEGEAKAITLCISH